MGSLGDLGRAPVSLMPKHAKRKHFFLMLLAVVDSVQQRLLLCSPKINTEKEGTRKLTVAGLVAAGPQKAAIDLSVRVLVSG